MLIVLHLFVLVQHSMGCSASSVLQQGGREGGWCAASAFPPSIVMPPSSPSPRHGRDPPAGWHCVSGPRLNLLCSRRPPVGRQVPRVAWQQLVQHSPRSAPDGLGCTRSHLPARAGALYLLSIPLATLLVLPVIGFMMCSCNACGWSAGRRHAWQQRWRHSTWQRSGRRWVPCMPSVSVGFAAQRSVVTFIIISCCPGCSWRHSLSS